MNELQRVFMEGRNTRIMADRAQTTTAISITTINIKPVADKRYRILVTLQRSDRPRYWNFLCNNCGSKVIELQNCDVIDMDDFYDPQSPTNMAIGRPCFGLEKTCPYSYFFKLF